MGPSEKLHTRVSDPTTPQTRPRSGGHESQSLRAKRQAFSRHAQRHTDTVPREPFSPLPDTRSSTALPVLPSGWLLSFSLGCPLGRPLSRKFGTVVVPKLVLCNLVQGHLLGDSPTCLTPLVTLQEKDMLCHRSRTDVWSRFSGVGPVVNVRRRPENRRVPGSSRQEGVSGTTAGSNHTCVVRRSDDVPDRDHRRHCNQ